MLLKVNDLSTFQPVRFDTRGSHARTETHTRLSQKVLDPLSIPLSRSLSDKLSPAMLVVLGWKDQTINSITPTRPKSQAPLKKKKKQEVADIINAVLLLNMPDFKRLLHTTNTHLFLGIRSNDSLAENVNNCMGLYKTIDTF